MKILNIYGQEAWHTEARIVGNREGLLVLKATIDRALTYKRATSSTDEKPNDGTTALFASDGEGYEVIVEMHNDIWGIQAPKDGFWNKKESFPQYIILEGQQER